MAAHKFLKDGAGMPTVESAIAVSAGASDAGKIPAVNDEGVLDSSIVNSVSSSSGAADAGKLGALNAGGKWDESFMPTGIGPETSVVDASENLAAGDNVNIYDSTGGKCRKADGSTAGKEAHGFVKAAVTSGQPATVYFGGINDQVTGLTPGRQYLSTTPGLCTAIAPSGSGNTVQLVGVATSSTSMNFRPQLLYVLD